jgi:ribonuclease P protein component
MPYIAKHLSDFTQKEITAIFRKSSRVYKGPGLDILMAPALKDFGRVLVVTPRKVGTAPERNRIRRRIKALFYEHKLYEYLFDTCIIIKKSGIDYHTNELIPLLDAAFKQRTNHSS